MLCRFSLCLMRFSISHGSPLSLKRNNINGRRSNSAESIYILAILRKCRKNFISTALPNEKSFLDIPDIYYFLPTVMGSFILLNFKIGKSSKQQKCLEKKYLMLQHYYYLKEKKYSKCRKVNV